MRHLKRLRDLVDLMCEHCLEEILHYDQLPRTDLALELCGNSFFLYILIRYSGNLFLGAFIC